jgi:hypothetical protein
MSSRISLYSKNGKCAGLQSLEVSVQFRLQTPKFSVRARAQSSLIRKNCSVQYRVTLPITRRCSSMVEQLVANQQTRDRYPSPAPIYFRRWSIGFGPTKPGNKGSIPFGSTKVSKLQGTAANLSTAIVMQ